MPASPADPRQPMATPGTPAIAASAPLLVAAPDTPVAPDGYFSDAFHNPRHDLTCDGYDNRWSMRPKQSPWMIGGWLQQGFTLNPDDPANGLNFPVGFNDQANDYQLNQLYLYLGRQVRLDGHSWDIGGRVDLNYGTDSRFVTVPGLEENDDGSPNWNDADSEYGLALPQAYVDVATPIGPYGSLIRIGHAYALGGYETFAAPDNFFYSHSYTYLFGEAFTQTGVTWMGKLTPTLAASVAITTGWDSFDRDNDAWGIRTGMMREFGGGTTTLAWTVDAGKDSTGFINADGSINDDRAWTSLVLKHYFNRDLYYVLQGDYGFQKNSVLQVDAGRNVGFDDGHWWGVNQQLVYQVNSKWSAGMRVEWFRDDGGSRLGVPIDFATGGAAFNGEDYVALTGGMNYKPHANVLLRSELRWDSTDVESNPAVPGGVAGIRPFNDRADDSQITIAWDAVLLF